MTEEQLQSGRTAARLRALAAVCLVAVAAWGLISWWQSGKAQAVRDLTMRPEAALPDYDCPDQQPRKTTDLFSESASSRPVA